MTSPAVYRPFVKRDRAACLALFDANCPAYFAPNERDEYKYFLDSEPVGYEVFETEGRIVASFGLIGMDNTSARLNWIMIDPDHHGVGIGSTIMEHVVTLARTRELKKICIAASHRSAPFFARFGAIAIARTKDGWGPGMDRIDMVLEP